MSELVWVFRTVNTGTQKHVLMYPIVVEIRALSVVWTCLFVQSYNKNMSKYVNCRLPSSKSRCIKFLLQFLKQRSMGMLG